MQNDYERIFWKDLPSTETPINAFNLNKMDLGIKNLSNKVDFVDYLFESFLEGGNRFTTPLFVNNNYGLHAYDITMSGASVQYGTPTPLNPVTIYNTGNVVSLRSCGKNLAEINVKSQKINNVNLIVNNDNTISLSGTANNDIDITLSSFVLPSGNYIVSSGINGSTENTYHVDLYVNDLLNTQLIESGSNVQTDSQADVKIKLFIKNNTMVNLVIKLQLEHGNTATEYQSFYGENYSIPIKTAENDEVFSEELGIWDEIKKNDDGFTYCIKKTNTIVYDGSEDEEWVKSTVAKNGYYIVDPSDARATLPFLSNICAYGSYGDYLYTPGYAYHDSNFCFSINDSIATNLNDFVSWIKQNPITVVYKSDTISRKLTDETLNLIKKIPLQRPSASLYCINKAPAILTGTYY